MTRAASGERGAAVRFPPPLVFLLSILAGVALHRSVRQAPVPVDRTVTVAGGIVLIALGVGLIAWARILFARTGQNPIPWKPSPELILQGPYRFTRNPMYAGMTLIQVGLGVAFNNLWIAALAACALLAVHVTAVLPEERYLSAKFGDDYRAYLGRVRRYL